MEITKRIDTMEKVVGHTTNIRDGMQLVVKPSSTIRSRVVSTNCHDGGKLHMLDNTPASMEVSGVIPALLSVYSDNSISALGQGAVQEPSLEIVKLGEKQCDDCSERVVVAAGMRSPDRDQKKNIRDRASAGNTLWSKVFKRFKIKSPKFPTSDAISKPSVGETEHTCRDVLEKTRGKRVGWVRVLCNLFKTHRRKPNHHSRSEMSSISGNYHLLGDEDSLPLLEHTEFQKGDAVACGGSRSANSDQLAYGPLTSYNSPSPWILRKWKLRNSQKFLSINPAKELLFHLTDDTHKQYTCSIQLENRTRRYVAFKFKGTSPQEYLMRPKHGILAPSTTLEVKGLRIGEPSSSARKKDLFVVVTLPIPASLMKGEYSTVSSSIFDRFQDQCYCEGVFYAVFPSGNSCSNVERDAFEGTWGISLTSVPEE